MKNGAVVASRTKEKVKENEKRREKGQNKADANPFEDALTKIGRASCRERV